MQPTGINSAETRGRSEVDRKFCEAVISHEQVRTGNNHFSHTQQNQLVTSLTLEKPEITWRW